MHTDRGRVDAGLVGADARAGRLRHGLRAGHRTADGIADGHQLPAVRAGGHIHVAVRPRPGGHALHQGRHVLPLQEPEPVAPGPGHERPVGRQPVRRAGRVRRVLQGGRVLHDQAEDDEPTAEEDTAVFQEVPARIARPARRRKYETSQLGGRSSSSGRSLLRPAPSYVCTRPFLRVADLFFFYIYVPRARRI